MPSLSFRALFRALVGKMKTFWSAPAHTQCSTAAPTVAIGPDEQAQKTASADPVAKRPLRGLRREIENAANEILELFIHAAHDCDTKSTKTYVNAHRDLWNCDFHYIDPLADKIHGEDRAYLLSDQKGQADAVWPIDMGLITYKEESAGYFIERIASASPSDVRGKVRLSLPRMLTISGGILSDDVGGRWWAETTICGLVNGTWRDIGNDVIAQRTSGSGENFTTVSTMRAPGDPEQINSSISVGLAVALTERYSWHVAFGVAEDGPRLLLPTNPGGCLSLFRDREKSETGRRAALRHWVSNHYRDIETSQADLVYVRDHLRGATNFDWRGLHCEILVSQFDLERNDFFRLQAEEWRSQRKHNRIRLRVKDRSKIPELAARGAR